MKAHLSKVVLALNATLTILVSNNALPPKYAVYGIAGLAFLQSVLPRVTQSSSDVKVADAAVAEKKNAEEKQ